MENIISLNRFYQYCNGVWIPRLLLPKLSDFVFYIIVAAGFLPDFVIQAGSLRFSSPDECM